ncbi:hypothetical protein [Bradyrhizobium japonicum]|uniref:hypothetical protein n=1 Tax=Bradyrhizobium japonicum TaxID=375 RepID=UPI000486CDF1|nr:hypothetical protein [Bradyrhizobium japonicum]
MSKPNEVRIIPCGACGGDGGHHGFDDVWERCNLCSGEGELEYDVEDIKMEDLESSPPASGKAICSPQLDRTRLEAAFEAYWAAEGGTFKGIEAAITAYLNGQDDLVERCAKIAEPSGPRPCDCERCDCHNQGDAEAVASWDAGMATANAIRALAART